MPFCDTPILSVCLFGKNKAFEVKDALPYSREKTLYELTRLVKLLAYHFMTGRGALTSAGLEVLQSIEWPCALRG